MAKYRFPFGGFQSTRPVGGATGDSGDAQLGQHVSIHAPRGGRDQNRKVSLAPERVSIHAPRGGRDTFFCTPKRRKPMFQSTRPVGGATWRFRRRPAWPARFNPRAPWGARLCSFCEITRLDKFQSTRPVGGATSRPLISEHRTPVSIHAPRGGRDTPSGGRRPRWTEFQSTRPVGGATEGSESPPRCSGGFNPRAPWGARPIQGRQFPHLRMVSIHAPRGGRDLSPLDFRASNAGFNPRAPWGARPIVSLQNLRKSCFNPRAPWGARLGLVV